MTDAPDRTRRATAAACLGGVALGVLAALGGAIWQQAALPQHVWTVEQSKEYDAAYAALHAATVGHDHDHESSEAEAADDHPDLAAAQARFDRVAAELQSARYAKDQLGGTLIRGGLAATAVFGVGYLATRSA